ncbi:G/U mismatch-specific DNA glycosylase [Corallococcus sp. BB11-1]|uniref:G/U mismatch-specific DNA glycosylase n=1 Tax=Corallococcus sp. BB11-1 TaxID=2996783 RepID=UPI00226F2E2E|nr:G/U mismatch-specific DNA glycosylase [Corallococcus sp. BB11-1]MCY1034074.1 G/U mismatch-specific DNA glycosylase [Corallococcus sp. BB11-1]
MKTLHRPTKDELFAATGRTVPDLLAPGMRVLFCGINPSLYSAVVGVHFARPGNRFWPAMHLAGFTPRRFLPSEQGEMKALGLGITNVVDRATASADQLEAQEYVEGRRSLERKVKRYRPSFLAVLGLGAYRSAFARPKARFGHQEETLGDTRLWVLPNPSGLNASYQLPDLARLFGELRRAVDAG